MSELIPVRPTERIGLKAMLLVTVMVISSLSAMVTIGGAEQGTAAATFADAPMGIFERIGTWPSGIRVQEAHVLSLPGELVVFASDSTAGSGQVKVWSYYESNNTWVQNICVGVGEDLRYTYQGYAADPANQRAFFFGGRTGGGGGGYTYYTDFYIYFHVNRTWVKINAPNAPSARGDFPMIYDAARDCIWLFGGSTGYGQRSNVLFRYSIAAGWAQFSPTNRPSARSGSFMTVGGDNVYVALGYLGGGGGGYANDLWSFNTLTSSWTQVKATLGVRTQVGAVLMYDADLDVLFLSLGYRPGQWSNEYLNHTYRINPSNGSYVQVYIDQRITPRGLYAYMVQGKEITIFGGNQGERDVWRLNIDTLQAVGIEPSTYNAGGTKWTGFDPDDGGRLYIISYRSSSFSDGGYYSSWLITYYSLSDGTWNCIDVNLPSGYVHRSGMAGAYDPVGDQFYLYGGYYSYTYGTWPDTETHYYFYDTFWRIFMGNGTMVGIEKKTTWPEPLGNGCMVVDYSSPFRKVFLFGGQVAGSTSTSDRIAYYNISSKTWVKLAVPITPPARMGTPLAMDPPRKAFFMFGGRDNSSNEYNDLWMFHTDTMKWEQMSGAQNPPSIRSGNGISVNSDTGEVMVFGDSDGELAYTYLYRPGWLSWIKTTENYYPSDWHDHGQAYSPVTRRHYIWNGPSDASEVWYIKPILRTIAEQARIIDGDGFRVTDVFPTYSDYTLRFSGYSDIGTSDIQGLDFELSNETITLSVSWTPGDGMDIVGPQDWVTFPGTPLLDVEAGGKWTLDVPIEFSLNGTDGSVYSISYVPVTGTGYTERRQAPNAFTLHTAIEVSKVSFSSDLQPSIEPGSWLFGGTDLDLSGFQLSFSADSNVHPVSHDFLVTYSNQEGVSEQWTYVPGELGNLSVPIVGEDGKFSKFYLNVTKGPERISTQVFSFRIDESAPSPPLGVSFKADAITDPNTNVDNDKDVYLTWEAVYDNGSGVKGICYSVDGNLWPSQDANITLEGKQIRLEEGRHVLYIWTVDKIGRVGPFATATITIDMHKPYFYDPVPLVANITAMEYTISIKVRDALSGVLPGSIEYHQTLENRLFGDYQKVPAEYITQEGDNYTVTMEIPLFIETKKNMVQFRANDVARNGLAESMIITINTDPELATPKVGLVSPSNGATITDPVTLSWSATFIDPDSLTYEVVVVDPRGNVFKNDTGTAKGASFSPTYPGVYHWRVTAKSSINPGLSEEWTFVYSPPFSTLTTPMAMTVKRNQSFEARVQVSNSLSVPVNLTFTKVDLAGLSLTGSTKVLVAPMSSGEMVLHLNASTAPLGERTLSFNVTDDLGRFGSISFKVIVEDDFVPPDGPIPVEEGFPLMIALIAAAVLLLIIGLIAFVVIRRKRGVFALKVEAPKEEDEEPFDLSYEPAGKVGKGSIPAGSVGRSEYEHLQRGAGSNVLELEVPSRKEVPVKHEEAPVKHEKEIEAEEVECRCGHVMLLRPKKKPFKFKCPECGRHGILEEDEEEELEEIEEFPEE